MSVLEELRLNGFVGYREARVEFTPGLNLITGRNSTGKTTLLEGILYGLFKEAPDGEDRLLVSRRARGTMQVYLKFRNPLGDAVEILRKGGLTSDGGYRTADQRMRVNGCEIPVSSQKEMARQVAEHLGVGPRSFRTLVYVQQGELTDILQPTRADMDLILRITRFRELQTQLDEAKGILSKFDGRDAATEAGTLEERIIPDLESNVSELRGDVNKLVGEVEELSEKIEKAESPQLEELLKTIGERDNMMDSVEITLHQAQSRLKEWGVDTLEGMKKSIKKLEKSITTSREKAEKKSKVAEELQSRFLEIKTKTTSLEEEAREHASLLEKGVTECPTCGQRISKETLSDIIDKKLEEAKELNPKVKEAEEAHRKAASEAQRLQSEVNDLDAELKRAKRDRDVATEQLKTLAGLKVKLEELLGKIGSSLQLLNLPFEAGDPDLKAKVAERLPLTPEEKEAHKKELREKTDELKTKKKRLQEREEKLEESRKLLEELRRRLERAVLAGELAKRIEEAVEERRSQLLRRIEGRALKIYGELTDQHIYAALRIDRENYRVWVQPKGADWIPATRTGGGHQTLIALALRLAVLEVLRWRRLLILDEPTYGVDEENLPQLLTHITQAAKHVSQVILVTHHGLGEEEATNIIKVALAEDGSSTAKSLI